MLVLWEAPWYSLVPRYFWIIARKASIRFSGLVVMTQPLSPNISQKLSPLGLNSKPNTVNMPASACSRGCRPLHCDMTVIRAFEFLNLDRMLVYGHRAHGFGLQAFGLSVGCNSHPKRLTCRFLTGTQPAWGSGHA